MFIVVGDKFKVFEGVFDEYTLKTLETLKRKNYFDKLGKPIKTGKEADVYHAYKGDTHLAIKIFRITSANFKKITYYIQKDHRFKTIKGDKRKIILQWAQKEFRNLLKCYQNGVTVPYPYKCYNNVVVMDYVDGGMVKDEVLENPQEFFEEVIDLVYLLRHEAQLVHGDLSAYNIMVQDSSPILIDIGQGMSIKNYDDFVQHYELYQRDIENIVGYFNKTYRLNIDQKEIFTKLDKP